MDDWMWVPGAKVQGHRAVVRQDDRGAVVRCSCGHPFLDQPSEHAAFLALVLHLGAAVRDGAAVTTGGGGDDDDGGGLAGVREPRGPVPPRGSGGVELDLP